MHIIQKGITFAIQKVKKKKLFKQYSTHKRFRIAWLLLLVYVPIMIAVTFHHHGEAQRVETAIPCQDCARHVHHDGHLLVLQHTMHDCVLCQLQSTSYLLPTFLTLSVFIVLHPIIRKTACAKCQPKANEVKSTRAPPYFAIF